MKEGFLILIRISRLCAVMYFAAWFSVFLEKLRYEREQKAEMRLELIRLEEKTGKQEIRDENTRQINERREEMRLQLLRLKEIKQEIIRRRKIKQERLITV